MKYEDFDRVALRKESRDLSKPLPVHLWDFPRSPEELSGKPAASQGLSVLPGACLNLPVLSELLGGFPELP